MQILVVQWEYLDGAHKGARFWAAHSSKNDGRFEFWPKNGMRPLGAALVEVKEGEGLHLLPQRIPVT